MQAARLCQQGVDLVCHIARFHQQALASIGQNGLARSLPFKQRDAQLRLDLRNCVTDRRNRLAHLPRRAAETALFGDRKEHAQLVDSWLTKFHRHIPFRLPMF